MLDFLWAFMLLIGILFAAFQGNLSLIADSFFSGAMSAIDLCFSMVGIVAFWSGLMKIAEESGIVPSLTRKMRPLLHFLFPNLSETHPAAIKISENIIANFLGLGWAATPAGLTAMEELAEINPKEGIASDEMCTFLVLNISSLQMVPVTLIAYRTQYGSVDPTAIVGPGILATLASTLAAILFIKWRTHGRKTS